MGDILGRIMVRNVESAGEYQGECGSGKSVSDLFGGCRDCCRRFACVASVTADHTAADGADTPVTGNGKSEF